MLCLQFLHCAPFDSLCLHYQTPQLKHFAPVHLLIVNLQLTEMALATVILTTG
jgi:hypothetical protein